jgi:hypothetical protein
MESALTWIKSSLCVQNGMQCVEAAHLPDGGVAVRNSREPGTELRYTAGEWDAFITGAKAGEFDRI